MCGVMLRATHVCPVAAPYRLDLTVSVLRRVSTNVVDVLTSDGQYVRALGGSGDPVIARVTQVHAKALAVTLDGDVREHARSLALVRRLLGVDRDLTHFDDAAARISWLKPLAERMRGVKPPRYPRYGRRASTRSSSNRSASLRRARSCAA